MKSFSICCCILLNIEMNACVGAFISAHTGQPSTCTRLFQSIYKMENASFEEGKKWFFFTLQNNRHTICIVLKIRGLIATTQIVFSAQWICFLTLNICSRIMYECTTWSLSFSRKKKKQQQHHFGSFFLLLHIFYSLLSLLSCITINSKILLWKRIHLDTCNTKNVFVSWSPILFNKHVWRFSFFFSPSSRLWASSFFWFFSICTLLLMRIRILLLFCFCLL